ncbi:MAG: nickel-dependent hydrogenase large subunit [Chloroflexota bacterium]|nr:MAG: nickel-dependent hydrogenase large subunit [Chloroflexota bacterium]
MTRLVIDPVTRVGGPLRVELDVQGGVVTDAWVAATMFRGLERTLIGRDPRDAWLMAQRVCGSCNGVHGLASVRAVEQALGIRIPANARLVRNLAAGAQLVTSHVTGFYRRQLPDWADLVAGATADPTAASELARSIGDSPASSASYFEVVRGRLAALVDSGQPGIFAPGTPGGGSRLTPAASLVVGAHSIEALEWRRSMTRLQTFLGGKSPHPQTLLVGGTALTPPWGGPVLATGEHPRRPQSSAPGALSERGLVALQSLIDGARDFVEGVYLPDVLYLADAYRDATEVGRGLGNLLAYGEFPEDDSDAPRLLLPRGRLMDGDLRTVDQVEEAGIAEAIGHAHYDGESGLVHPSDGRTEPRYHGPRPPVTSLEGAERYSWAKAPRYWDDPMEVGPAARIAVALATNGEPALIIRRVLADLGIAPEALGTTFGRIVAGAIEARLVVDRLAGWLAELRANLAAGDLAFADISAWNPDRWPVEAEGWSLAESPGGALGHWLRIRDRRIAAYQVIDGSTWNLSPRDDRGRRGALEEALVGTPVPDLAAPVDVLRTIHAFDPCPACAVH